jgi:hypothetical protein
MARQVSRVGSFIVVGRRTAKEGGTDAFHSILFHSNKEAGIYAWFQWNGMDHGSRLYGRHGSVHNKHDNGSWVLLWFKLFWTWPKKIIDPSIQPSIHPILEYMPPAKTAGSRDKTAIHYYSWRGEQTNNWIQQVPDPACVWPKKPTYSRRGEKWDKQSDNYCITDTI